MKVLAALFVLVLLFGFAVTRPVYAQNDLLIPVPSENLTQPSLKILSPGKDSVVQSKFTIQFDVTNFKLTAKPENSAIAGVIAIYVDGKFFTNTASTSAQLTIPRAGTHRVEAELTHVDRLPLVPRISDAMYIHTLKKSPFLIIPSTRVDTTVYDEQPRFPVDFQLSSFEDKSLYYQVFVDGEVDGTSKEASESGYYRIQNPLTEGKHSLRLALYNENDRPYVPTVEYQIPFIYSSAKPVISKVDFPDSVKVKEPVPIKLELSQFEVGKDGYVDVLAEGVHYYWSEAKGSLPNLSSGNQKITFTLLDKEGFALNPSITTQKIISVDTPLKQSGTVNSLFPSGTFITAEDGQQPRWGFLALGALEAIAIIVFGVLLLKHERHK